MTAVDTHVHIWDPRLLDYPWLRGADALDAPFLPADFPSVRTERVVFVQADCAPAQALDEASWVAGLAPEWPQLAGIVAGADLRSPELEQHLDSLSEIGLVVGVRHLLQGEPVERLSEPALRRGLGALAARGFTFDACIQHPQLGALIELLDRIPQLQVVLDHLGKPPVEEGMAGDAGRRWSDGIRRLAEREGTFVKLSGLPAETADRAAYEAHAADFLAVALDAFGPERAMLGSDWPVSARVGVGESPLAWTERVRVATSVDAREWDLIAGETGSRFYRLSETP
ncbi:amidohydrolase family protein [Microbacterium pumilum]|uniref:amidohydrolase family protein n=1 Tax=Microbacterium pumilum TaxID=344165 RepID=UPI0031DCC954